MSNYQLESSKLDLKPKRHHGYAVLLFIMGTLFPPMAVAARFGFGGDFWLNLLLTICGYIPGHGHNFYIQNIRNNKNHRRTPKWAQRYGLVDTSEIKRKERKSQWAIRYNDRLPDSTLEGQPYEEGEVPGSSSREDSVVSAPARLNGRGEELWREDDERYFAQNGDARSTRSGESGGTGRWHYPANFEDTLPPLDGDSASGTKKKKKAKAKKDRWARTEDAYSMPDEGSTKKRKKKKKNKSTVGNGDADDSYSFDRQSVTTADVPENPEGGTYNDRWRNDAPEPPPVVGGRQRDELDHQF